MIKGYVEEGLGLGLEYFADEGAAFLEEGVGDVHDPDDALHDQAAVAVDVAREWGGHVD